MKTNKSFTKRLRVTKNGKIVSRKPGFRHFNAKQSRSKQLGGKRSVAVIMSNKDRGRFMPQ